MMQSVLMDRHGDALGEKRLKLFLAGMRIRLSDFDEFLHIPGIEQDHAEPVEAFRFLSAEPAG